MDNGSIGVYRLTDSSQAISDASSKVTGNTKRYYEDMGFQGEIEEMGNNSVYGHMNDVNCFVSSIVQSHNLVNAAHYDIGDSTASIATWTKSRSGGATDWYL